MATQDFQSEYWPNLPADSLSADPIDLANSPQLDNKYVKKSGDTMTGPLVVPDATADGQALAHSQAGAVLDGLVVTTEVTVPPVPDGATSAAAQVTAKDSTTGQLQIGGVEVGDTGGRDISSLLNPNFAAVSRAVLRRCGNVVTVELDWLPHTGNTGQVFTIPNGFKVSLQRGVVVGTSSNGRYYLSGSACEIQVAASGNGGFTSSWTTSDAWPTSLPGTPA